MNVEKSNLIFYLSILSVISIVFALIRELGFAIRIKHYECTTPLIEIYCGREGMLKVLGETYIAFLLPMSASLMFPFPLLTRVIIWAAIPVPAIIFKHFEY